MGNEVYQTNSLAVQVLLRIPDTPSKPCSNTSEDESENSEPAQTMTPPRENVPSPTASAEKHDEAQSPVVDVAAAMTSKTAVVARPVERAFSLMCGFGNYMTISMD